jgi:hypothetical protein
MKTENVDYFSHALNFKITTVMTQGNGSLMIKPAVKNENAADLPLQI